MYLHGSVIFIGLYCIECHGDRHPKHISMLQFNLICLLVFVHLCPRTNENFLGTLHFHWNDPYKTVDQIEGFFFSCSLFIFKEQLNTYIIV
jgi:hypothetical protein